MRGNKNMPKKYKYIILCIICSFLFLILLFITHRPIYAETFIEVTEDGRIYLITTEEGMDEVIEEVTPEELADIYYNQPAKLPQDDDSLNIVRQLIAGYEDAEFNQEGGILE
jgi:hypothetical protein